MSEREQAVAGKAKSQRQMYEPCLMCVDGAILDGGGSVHQCCCQSMRVMPVGVPVETLEYLVNLDELRKGAGITAAMLRDGRAAAAIEACRRIKDYDDLPLGSVLELDVIKELVSIATK